MEQGILVSVLMTAYNRENYIAEAIESVLDSTYTNFELIIVDDCSTDTTVAIAKNYEDKDKRVKVFINKINLGQFGNRNKAAGYAGAELIKFFDSDDIMYSDCLEVMVKAMKQFPNAAVGAVTKDRDVNNSGVPREFKSRESFINHFFNGSPLLYIGPSGSIFKREVFNEFKGFDEHIGILADTYLMLKIAAKYSVVGFKWDIFHWRLHDGQVTIGQSRWFEMQSERFEINEIILMGKQLPLPQKDVFIIKRNLKNIMVRNIIKRAIFKVSFTEACKMSIFCKLKLTDFLKALLPNKVIKLE